MAPRASRLAASLRRKPSALMRRLHPLPQRGAHVRLVVDHPRDGLQADAGVACDVHHGRSPAVSWRCHSVPPWTMSGSAAASARTSPGCWVRSTPRCSRTPCSPSRPRASWARRSRTRTSGTSTGAAPTPPSTSRSASWPRWSGPSGPSASAPAWARSRRRSPRWCRRATTCWCWARCTGRPPSSCATWRSSVWRIRTRPISTRVTALSGRAPAYSTSSLPRTCATRSSTSPPSPAGRPGTAWSP